jgi:multiple sugar transport system substrate-binding protein
MNRKFALKLLAVAVAAALLVATAFAKDAKKPKKAVPGKPYMGVQVIKDKRGKAVNLGGIEVIVADWWSPANAPEPANAAEEATAEFREWLQATYNFKIKQVGVDGWGKHPETFANFASNGGKENYVFVMYQSSIAAPMKNGLCYDLSTLDCLDFKKPKWIKTVKELTTNGNKVFGMRAIDPEPKMGLYFNKRMLQEAGIEPESIYDMQAKGTWTWDAFEKVCAKVTRDTNNDGVVDVYALTNFSVNFFNAVLPSNNATFVSRDAKGKYVNATNTPEFLEAMNWGSAIIKKYEMPAPKDAQWNYSFASFRNGEAAMSVSGVYESGNMKQMKDDFGFVCFPKGPKTKDYVNVWDDNVYMIPSCYDAERAWKIAFAFNLYTETTPGYEGSEDWKTGYYGNFRDTRSVDESIAKLKKNGVVWFHPMITGLNVGDIIYNVYGQSATPAQQIEKVANPWQALIDEANKGR